MHSGMKAYIKNASYFLQTNISPAESIVLKKVISFNVIINIINMHNNKTKQNKTKNIIFKMAVPVVVMLHLIFCKE
jgi:hypothetical protein